MLLESSLYHYLFQPKPAVLFLQHLLSFPGLSVTLQLSLPQLTSLMFSTFFLVQLQVHLLPETLLKVTVLYRALHLTRKVVQTHCQLSWLNFFSCLQAERLVWIEFLVLFIVCQLRFQFKAGHVQVLISLMVFRLAATISITVSIRFSVQ